MIPLPAVQPFAGYSIPFPATLPPNMGPKVHGIYRLTHEPSQRHYVGSAANLVSRRYKHLALLRDGKHFNIHLQRAWDKYGSDGWTWHVLETVTDKSALAEAEQRWMKHYNCHDQRHGFNICPVARSWLGQRHSEESRRMMSLAKKGKKLAPAHLEKLRLARTGRKMPREGIEKTRLKLLGRTLSAEHRAKVSRTLTGYKQTAEHRRNVGNALRGKPSPRKRGHVFTEDDIRTIRRRCAAGEVQRQVARDYCVHFITIWSIHKRRAWSWVQDSPLPENSPAMAACCA